MARKAKISANMNGIEKLQADLDSFSDNARTAAADALESWGESVQDDAKRDVPTLSGLLYSSIETRTDRSQLVTQIGVWESQAYYAIWAERGNSRQKAQPFLLPAFEKHRGEFRIRLRQEIIDKLS